MDPKLVQDINGAMPAFKTGQNLENDTRDMIFQFLQTVALNREASCGQRVPHDAMITKLDEELVGPLIKQYPGYSFWILNALDAGSVGNHFPPVTSNGEYKLARSQAEQASAAASDDAQLKTMLLSDNRYEVFAAAKRLKMVHKDVVETDSNFKKLQDIVKALVDLGLGL